MDTNYPVLTETTASARFAYRLAANDRTGYEGLAAIRRHLTKRSAKQYSAENCLITRQLLEHSASMPFLSNQGRNHFPLF